MFDSRSGTGSVQDKPGTSYLKARKLLKTIGIRDFPGGTVVKNPPANAGDTGSSPGPGRSHVPQRN